MNSRLPGFVADANLPPVTPAALGSTAGHVGCVLGCMADFAFCTLGIDEWGVDTQYIACVCMNQRGFCLSRCYGTHFEPQQCVSNAH